MGWKDKAWKYATAFVVVLIILNPELAEMALFIDAVGLEMFLFLVEVQVVAILGAFLNTRIRPVYIYIKNMFLGCHAIHLWKIIRSEPASLMLAVPSPAFFMHILVISILIQTEIIRLTLV
jgi:hypothetical protein